MRSVLKSIEENEFCREKPLRRTQYYIYLLSRELHISGSVSSIDHACQVDSNALNDPPQHSDLDLLLVNNCKLKIFEGGDVEDDVDVFKSLPS